MLTCSWKTAKKLHKQVAHFNFNPNYDREDAYISDILTSTLDYRKLMSDQKSAIIAMSKQSELFVCTYEK